MMYTNNLKTNALYDTIIFIFTHNSISSAQLVSQNYYYQVMAVNFKFRINEHYPSVFKQHYFRSDVMVVDDSTF